MAIPQLQMLEQKEVVIGDNKYLIQKFPATKGLKYMTILTKVLSPLYSKMNSEDGLTFGQLVETLLTQLETVDEDIVKEMIILSTGMQDRAFEFEFSGKVVVMFELLKAILFFNYEDVFSQLGLQEVVE
jgi:hypothetical protein